MTGKRDEGSEAGWRPSAKLGNPKAAYNLALLYLDGQTLPQDLKRSAELAPARCRRGQSRGAIRVGDILQGRHRRREEHRQARSGCCRQRHMADNVDAEVEYAIALYNGTGTPKNETAAIGLAAQGRQAKQPDCPEQAGPRIGQLRTSTRLWTDWRGLKWHIRRQNRRQRAICMLDEMLGQGNAGRARQSPGGCAQMARLLAQMIRP